MLVVQEKAVGKACKRLICDATTTEGEYVRYPFLVVSMCVWRDVEEEECGTSS